MKKNAEHFFWIGSRGAFISSYSQSYLRSAQPHREMALIGTGETKYTT